MIFGDSDKILFKATLPAEAKDAVKEFKELPHWGGFLVLYTDEAIHLMFEAFPDAQKTQKWFSQKNISVELSRNSSIRICQAVVHGKDRLMAASEELESQGISNIYEYNVAVSLKTDFALYIKESDKERASDILNRFFIELSAMSRITVPYKGSYNGFADMDTAFRKSGFSYRRGYKCFFCDPKIANELVRIGSAKVRENHFSWAEWKNMPPEVIRPVVSKIKQAKAKTEDDDYKQMNIFSLLQGEAG